MRMLLACLSCGVFALLATAQNLRRRPMWAGRCCSRHSDPTGKPCLDVSTRSRPHTINPNLYDHVISTTDRCAERIKVQVYYYKTQRYTSMEIAGRASKEAILEMIPSMKDFRDEFRGLITPDEVARVSVNPPRLCTTNGRTDDTRPQKVDNGLLRFIHGDLDA